MKVLFTALALVTAEFSATTLNSYLWALTRTQKFIHEACQPWSHFSLPILDIPICFSKVYKLVMLFKMGIIRILNFGNYQVLGTNRSTFSFSFVFGDISLFPFSLKLGYSFL